MIAASEVCLRDLTPQPVMRGLCLEMREQMQAAPPTVMFLECLSTHSRYLLCSSKGEFI